MKIKTITSRNRRDFNAIYECEHCGAEEKSSGYDDSYFHSNVIPKMECKKCGEKSLNTFKPLTPKYSSNEVV